MFKGKKKLKSENAALKLELRKANAELLKTKDKLQTIRVFEKRYCNQSEAYKQRCSELETEISKLKKEMRALELGNKAIKAAQAAY